MHGSDSTPTSPRQATRSWRDWLPIHPAAEMFPLMSDAELRELAADIKKHGLRTPVVLQEDQNGDLVLLDGRNRLDALTLLGVEITLEKIAGGMVLAGKSGDVLTNGLSDWESDDTDPYAYVVSANVHRRHLTAEQRRELIANLLKATPEKSNRQIAETVKASHATVGAVRAEMQSTGQIDQLTKTVGKDGKARKQPARKPAAKDPHVAAAVDRAVARSEQTRRKAKTRADSANVIELSSAAAIAKKTVSGSSTVTNRLVVDRLIDDLLAFGGKLEPEIVAESAVLACGSRYEARRWLYAFARMVTELAG
jgi:ParB-like chromosome segregation protein Spo0J